MSKHTPGPWTLCPKEEGLFPHVHIGPIRLYDYGCGEQCTSYLTINEGPSPEMVAEYKRTGNDSNLCGTTSEACWANACLIASAPDMLAALRLAQDSLRAWNSMGISGPAKEQVMAAYENSPEMRAISEAIAKAEGQ